MKLEQALDLLDLERKPEDPDIIEELIEEAVFPLREYFLRNPVVPVLYRSRLARIKQLQAAGESLGLSTSKSTPLTTSKDFSESDLAELLRAFEAALSQARLQVAQHLNPSALVASVEQMIAIQESFEHAFLRVTAHFASAESNILAADVVDTGKLLMLLQHEDPSSTELIEKERKRIEIIHERLRRQ
ncbi:hypothetical protein [Sanyastnella coralliicola]|uniref:hypothetical protein n=1 Tax=Sanyastnella coralliicola TaxID=3069118 RepID=UPI0027BAC792|nr:hypothetical protein [Longitalea sp. SCSIO 12813]